MKNLFTAIKLAIITLFYFNNIASLKAYPEIAPVREFIVDALPGTEVEIINQYMDSNGRMEPIVFRGAAKKWPTAQWTPQSLAFQYAGEQIMAPEQDGSVIEICTTFDHMAKAVSRDYPNDIEANSNYFVTAIHSENGCQNPNYNSEVYMCKNKEKFLAQIHFPKMRDEGADYVFFIGPKGTHTPFHSHQGTFLAQMYGSKLATLVAPEDKQKIAPTEILDGELVHQYHDLLNPEQAARIHGITIYQTTLYSGDILYIPDNWLHDIKAESGSISIAHGS